LTDREREKRLNVRDVDGVHAVLWVKE
jgi:hypothetical protein